MPVVSPVEVVAAPAVDPGMMNFLIELDQIDKILSLVSAANDFNFDMETTSITQKIGAQDRLSQDE